MRAASKAGRLAEFLYEGQQLTHRLLTEKPVAAKLADAAKIRENSRALIAAGKKARSRRTRSKMSRQAQ